MGTHEIYGKNILIISGEAHTTSSVQPHLSLHSLAVPAFFCTLLPIPTPPSLKENIYRIVSGDFPCLKYYLVRKVLPRDERDSYPTVAPCLISLHQSQLSSEIPKYERVGSAVRTEPLSNPLNRALQLNRSLSVYGLHSLYGIFWGHGILPLPKNTAKCLPEVTQTSCFYAQLLCPYVQVIFHT